MSIPLITISIIKSNQLFDFDSISKLNNKYPIINKATILNISKKVIVISILFNIFIPNKIAIIELTRNILKGIANIPSNCIKILETTTKKIPSKKTMFEANWIL